MRRSYVALIVFSLACSAGVAAPPDSSSDAITPTEPIKLFNGKDLTNFHTWLTDTLHEDPRGVFTVKDGLLHISGDGLGGLITNKDYRNYHLVTEFRWGKKTWNKRAEKSRDAGILLHCVGPDGNAGPWMASIEAQIIEGGVGDILVVGGKYEDGSPVPMSLTADIVLDRDGEKVWKKGGTPTTVNRGRINWYGRDPDWKDVLGYRGANDVESPGEEWTTMECICDGDKVQYIVNGTVVNEGYKSFPSAGKLLVQSEYAEIIFRKIDLLPLDKK